MSTKTTKAQDLLNRISHSLKKTISDQAEEANRKNIAKELKHKRLNNEAAISTARIASYFRMM